MKKLIMALLLFLYGCSDNPDGWEANIVLREYSPDAVMSTESMLYSNGYRRVKFYYSTYRSAYIFHATRKKDND
jgi:hypothetical protein